MSSKQKSASPAGSAGPADTATPWPTRLTVAAAICAVQGAAVAVAGLWLAVMGLVGDPDSPQQAEVLAVMVIVLALLPSAAARGLWHRRRWSRGPAMITQIMALPVAWTLVRGGGALIAVGVVTAAAAIAVLVALVNPTATEALGIGPRDA